MSTIGVQDLRSGTTFQMEGQPYVVLKYEHVKMGRGSATIRVKVRQLLSGAVVEKSFVNSAKVEEIDIQRKAMQYLYADSGGLAFMDPQTFEQVSLAKEVLGEAASYLKEGLVVNILFWGERALGVELPPKMEFEVMETDPGVKGNSVANIYKSARLENGLTTRVPLFVETGERVVVDTRDGSYVERAAKKS